MSVPDEEPGLWELGTEAQRGALAPPDVGPMRDVVRAIDALREHLQTEEWTEQLDHLSKWEDHVYYRHPSERWVAEAVAFMLRAELRAFHAEKRAAERYDFESDQGRYDFESDDARASVRAMINAQPDLVAFIENCLSMASCFMPTAPAGKPDACGLWRGRLLDALLFELNHYERNVEHTTMGIGTEEELAERSKRRRVP